MVLREESSISGSNVGSYIFATPLTQNSIPFVDVDGKLSEDNTNLIWDDTLKKLHLKGDTLEIGTVLIEDSNGCLTTTEFHAHGKDGVSGYLKIKQGTTPSAHAEANHSVLWVNSSEKLILEKADGTDLEVGIMAASMTEGSIPFADADGMLAQDNAKLFWDNTEKRLGIGINSPDNTLHVFSSSTNVIKAERSSSTTNTTLRVLELHRRTTGTAANNIGAELAFRLEDDGGGLETTATIQSILTNVSADSEEGALAFEVVSDSNLVEALRIQGVSGGNANVGIGDTSPDNELTIRAEHAASIIDGTYVKIINSLGNAVGRNTGILFQGYSGTNYVKTGIFARTLDNFIRQDLIFAVETTQDDSNVDINDAIITIKGDTGFVGIGEPSPGWKLTVVDEQSGGGIIVFHNKSTSSDADGISIRCGPNSNPGTGNDYIKFYDGNNDRIGQIEGNGGGGVAYNTTSDERIKRNIVDTKYTLKELLKIKVRDYNPIGKDTVVTGLVAQELYEVLPQVVGKGEGDELWSVSYGAITPFLIKAVQDLQKQIDELRTAS